jgi:hypothetical protein
MRTIKLAVEELEARIAPSSITTLNPAGNTPQGGGALNGTNVDAFNPAGHLPPGQQPADQGAGTGN